MLQEKLGVLGQWRLQDKVWQPAPLSANLSAVRGVRRDGDDLQMGLKKGEIHAVHRQLVRLLERIDKGEIKTVPEPST
jgi:hypothetical protein